MKRRNYDNNSLNSSSLVSKVAEEVEKVLEALLIDNFPNFRELAEQILSVAKEELQ